jgi:hypothetical protein
MITRRLLLWSAGAALAARGAPEAAPVRLTDAEKERFLREADVLFAWLIEQGITGSRRATLSDGAFKHDAHVQTVDRFSSLSQANGLTEVNFRDTYRHNLAAYRLDRLLGIGMVPVSVEREWEGKPAAFTWWVDEFAMSERDRYQKGLVPPDKSDWNKQILIVRLFDQLIDNPDRNLGNLLITRDWRVWMIDHTRAFRVNHQARSVEGVRRCERRVWRALRELTREAVEQETGKWLSELQISALMARRERILRHLEQRIAREGEGAVLYDYLTGLEN